MRFRRLGRSGLNVACLAYGSWLSLGGQVTSKDTITELIKCAWQHGCNTFDTAEVYSKSEAEKALGQAFLDLKLKREELVVITKVYFGTGRKDPNQSGVSRKHIIEGCKASLKRLQLDYVDVLMAHRDDETVPVEEVVRAFNHLIDQGLVHYWGTSHWSAARITEAFHVAEKLGLIAPIAEQCKHHMLWREKVDGELATLIKERGLGTTTWSPLAQGLLVRIALALIRPFLYPALTGKYAQGVPEESRFNTRKDLYQENIDRLQTEEGKAELAKVAKLQDLAGKLDTSVSALAIAWQLKNNAVSTVLLGATRVHQLEENFKALDVVDKLTPEYMSIIEGIIDSHPSKSKAK